MSDWRKRPTLIDEWNESIDYIMAIDENGTTDLEGVKALFNGNYIEQINASIKPSLHLHDRWFTITGIVMKRGNFPTFKDNINTIKYAYWEDGLYKYRNGERRVVFHSREIRKKEGPFNPKIIDYKSFVSDISNMMKNVDYDIYSSSIDKIRHITQYTEPYHVYTLCLNFIVERFCRELNRKNKKGILLLEARGKEEDTEVLEYLVDLISNGNNYHEKSHFDCIDGVYFNPKWCFTKNKAKASFIMLELADLASFPIFKYVKTGNKDLAFNSIEIKFRNYPYYTGYGLKKFP